MLNDSLLMIIDMQEKLSSAMSHDEMQEAVSNTQLLIDSFGKFNVPVIATEQYPSGLGPILKKLKGADYFPSVKIMEKLHFDTMKESSIAEYTASLGRKKIVLAGIEAHICVYRTALSFLSNGYEVYVASDAVASRNPRSMKFALMDLSAKGVSVLPSESLIYMLIERAGCDEFKYIHRLTR